MAFEYLLLGFWGGACMEQKMIYICMHMQLSVCMGQKMHKLHGKDA